MASVTLEQMKEYGLNQVCLDLCRGILNTQTADGSELRKLLPVKYIINNWNAYNEIVWVNPITKEEFKEKWSGERTRLKAIDEINKRIDDYNEEVERLDSQYTNIEARINKQRHRPRTHFLKYLLTVWCHNPVHTKPELWDKKSPFDSRQFNNETIYDLLAQCLTEEEALGSFNQMLYEYICAITEGQVLIETSTLWFPKLEFEDYFMRTQSKFPNLLQDKEEKLKKKNYSPFDEMLSFPTYTAEQLRRRERPPSPNPHIYPKDIKVVLDWEAQTIDATRLVGSVTSQTQSFYRCGFIGKEGKPNRWMVLLCQFAHFLEMSKDKPHIEKADLFKELVICGRKKNTFNKYLNDLETQLAELFRLTLPSKLGKGKLTGKELLDYITRTPEYHPIFTKVEEQTTMRGATGREITTKHKYYTTELQLELKSFPKELRETTKDGFMETYSSDTESSVQ
jgi:uncharacterized small protein (DUF1192 family)